MSPCTNSDHDHEHAAEAQIEAAVASELGSREQIAALRIAEVEAQLATARALRRLADAAEAEHGREPRRPRHGARPVVTSEPIRARAL